MAGQLGELTLQSSTLLCQLLESMLALLLSFLPAGAIAHAFVGSRFPGEPEMVGIDAGESLLTIARVREYDWRELVTLSR